MSASFYQKHLLTKFDKKNVIYVAYVGLHGNKQVYKYGKSYDIFQREYLSHRKNFPVFEMKHIFYTNYKDHVEKTFEKELKLRDLHLELNIKNKKQTELFHTTDEYNLKYILYMIKQIIAHYNSKDDMYIMLKKQQMEIQRLQLQLLQMEKNIQ